MVYIDYPRVKQSLGIAALRDAYPTLSLNLHGDIRGVNPLALWLWGALKGDESFHPERFLGINAFTMAATQFYRIPAELNREFYIKRSALVKRQDAFSRATIYAPFIAAMHSDPARAELYESASNYPEQEWEYPLTIAHPEQPEIMLEFQADVYRLEENGGFLLVYYPVKAALPVIEEINSRLVERLGKVISLQVEEQEREEPDKTLSDTGYHVFYREYYPRLMHDALWYICGENKAHQLMMGMSVRDLHFFEMFLTPLVRYFLGAIQESTAPRALKYFDLFTAPYMREEHDLHEQYVQTMRRLSQLDEFGDVLIRARRWNIHLNPIAQIKLLARSDEPFYTCRVILPWRFEPDVHLQFKSMVRFLFDEGMVPQNDRRKYEITLIPENYETDAAMLLLPLLMSPPPDIAETAALAGHDQSHLYPLFLWLLALVKVVDNAMETIEENTAWEPEGTFARIYSDLKARPGMTRQGQTEEMMLKTDFRVTLELLGRKGKVSKFSVLTLLRTFMLTWPRLKPLSDFLAQELTMEQRV
ncbi:MAG: hypothetical protein ACRDIV_06665 [Ktedonobacteraceae bacterium]